MDPQEQFCHNPDCPDTSGAGRGDEPAARPCLDHRVGSEDSGVCAQPCLPLVCVDGLASYVTAFLRVFRDPLRTGRRGRPRLVVESGLLIIHHVQGCTYSGQVIKRYARRCVVTVAHRVVRGTATAIARVLNAMGGGTVINTASIERLNATFVSALAPLARRGRAIAHSGADRRDVFSRVCLQLLLVS